MIDVVVQVVWSMYVVYVLQLHPCHCSVNAFFAMGRKKMHFKLVDSDSDVGTTTPAPKKRSKGLAQRVQKDADKELENLEQFASTEDPSDDAQSAATIFQKHGFSMWLSNKSSAKEVQVLATKAQKAGAQGMHDIAKVGRFGEHPKNMARELKRKAKRDSKMPPLYYAAIPCWDATQKEMHRFYDSVSSTVRNYLEFDMCRRYISKTFGHSYRPSRGATTPSIAELKTPDQP